MKDDFGAAFSALLPHENVGPDSRRLHCRKPGRNEIVRRGFGAAVVNDVLNRISFSEYKRRQMPSGRAGIEGVAAGVWHRSADSRRAAVLGHGLAGRN
jgi:hypothetical protein